MYVLRTIYSLVAIVTGVAADAPLIRDFRGYNNGTYGVNPNQTYHSSNISSPLWQVNAWNETAVDPTPYLFTAFPEKWAPWGTDPGNYGPYIYSTKDLSLVYAAPLFKQTKIYGIQEYNGTSYLTFFAGKLIDGEHGNGKCYLMDSTYTIAHVISAVNAPQDVDLHECFLTTEGTAVITSYYNIPYDLTPVGGPVNGTLIDSMFQEVDIATGALIYEWKATDHFPLSSSYSVYDATKDAVNGFDYFHLNSIEKVSRSSTFHDGLSLTGAYAHRRTRVIIWSRLSSLALLPMLMGRRVNLSGHWEAEAITSRSQIKTVRQRSFRITLDSVTTNSPRSHCLTTLFLTSNWDAPRLVPRVVSCRSMPQT
jgi:hypothetical protein